jgi:hypothetical protein
MSRGPDPKEHPQMSLVTLALANTALTIVGVAVLAALYVPREAVRLQRAR